MKPLLPKEFTYILGFFIILTCVLLALLFFIPFITQYQTQKNPLYLRYHLVPSESAVLEYAAGDTWKRVVADPDGTFTLQGKQFSLVDTEAAFNEYYYSRTLPTELITSSGDTIKILEFSKGPDLYSTVLLESYIRFIFLNQSTTSSTLYYFTHNNSLYIHDERATNFEQLGELDYEDAYYRFNLNTELEGYQKDIIDLNNRTVFVGGGEKISGVRYRTLLVNSTSYELRYLNTSTIRSIERDEYQLYDRGLATSIYTYFDYKLGIKNGRTSYTLQSINVYGVNDQVINSITDERLINSLQYDISAWRDGVFVQPLRLQELGTGRALSYCVSRNGKELHINIAQPTKRDMCPIDVR